MIRIPAAVFTRSTFQEFREFAAFVCFGFALCSGLQAASPPIYSIGDPSDHEQEFLELINRARANPAAEGARLASTADPDVLSAFQSFSVDLALMRSEFESLPVRPPLAFNAALHDAAKAHSQDMFDNAFQGHTGSTGSTMVSRAYAAGYSFSSLAENVYSYGKSVWHGHAGFQVDWGYGPGGMQTGRGHRINIHGNYREIGIGVIKGYHSSSGNSVGPLVITQNFGSRSNSSAFITGVAYYDINGNGLYDAGEGIGGLDVRVSGASYAAVTSTSGGYTVPVPATDATRTVTFSGRGFDFAASARTSGGANAKLDFTPDYTPIVISGPATIHAGENNRVTFTGIGGVIGYDWRYAALSAFTSDPAENLNQVTPLVTGSYTPLSTSVKQQGAASYHLAHATPADQIILYQSDFLVGTGASMQFGSRLGYATSSQVAQVEVSTDEGRIWTAVYSQTGSGGAGETSFTNRNIPLGPYAGKTIKLRLRYTYLTGGYLFQGTDIDRGWFVDNLVFSGLSSLSQANVTHGGLDTFFDFTPPSSGRYLLAVRGRLPGRSLPYGQELEIEALSTTPPPTQPEIAVELIPGGSLNSNGPAVDFGSHETGSTSAAKTFTIRNTGTADLTGIFISKTGSNPGDYLVSGPTTSTLAPGANSTFTVVFKPTAAGSRSATLQIASNDADENPFNIAVSGSGTIPLAPAITVEQPVGTGLTSSSISAFGDSNVGAASQAKTFTIRNTGNATLSSIAVSKTGAHAGDFTVNTGSMASSLAPGASTTFSVTFSPTSAGARSASIQIVSNDADENPFVIAVTGDAVGQPTVGPTVGREFILNLGILANPGETIKLVGKLPKGLKFNASTGLFSGVISGKPGSYPLTVQFLQGKTVVRTVSLPLTIKPYPTTLLGSFEGLLEDATGIPTGVIRLSITKPNAWSATLESVGAAKRSAKGSFLLDQQTDTVTITANFPVSGTAPAESVTLTLTADSPLFAGTHSRGTLRGFRIAQGAEIISSTAVCNIALDAGVQDGIQTPAGIGWLSGKFGKTGSGSFKGLLGDATSTSVSLRISATGQALFWAQPYSNKQSYIAGIIDLPATWNPSSGNQQLESGLWWFKAADAKTLAYPVGFGPLPVESLSAARTPAASALALGNALDWQNGRTVNLEIEGAGLSNLEPQPGPILLPTELTLDDRYNFTATTPAIGTRAPWIGKLAIANGSISGTLTLPAGFSPDMPALRQATASGVLLPSADPGLSGIGLLKVPSPGPKGAYRTAALEIGQ